MPTGGAVARARDRHRRGERGPPNPASLGFHAARGFVGVGEQDTEGGTRRVRLLVRELG